MLFISFMLFSLFFLLSLSFPFHASATVFMVLKKINRTALCARSIPAWAMWGRTVSMDGAILGEILRSLLVHYFPLLLDSGSNGSHVDHFFRSGYRSARYLGDGSNDSAALVELTELACVAHAH